MKLPKRVNYAEAYLTLRCNLGCDYCINDNGEVSRSRHELTGEEWIDALNEIDFGDVPLTLGGGEPTMHPDFFQIVQDIKPETKLDLLTNLDFDINRFASRVNPEKFSVPTSPAYKAIRASYHPTKMDPQEISDKVARLQEEGFPIGLFGINHPHAIEANMQMAETAREKGIYFFVKDFLGEHDGDMHGHYAYPAGLDGKRKTAICRSKDLLIGPAGGLYKCHRDLYRGENDLGCITTANEIENKWRWCDKYGECNPCDVKKKTNRFLQAGNCQVEIKDAK